MTDATASTAADIAAAIYRDSDTTLEWTDRPDGVEILTLPNGYSLAISDDRPRSDEDRGGINWWVNSPDESGIESDGWDYDATPEGVHSEIASLVRHIATLAAR
jgi:hypothetical protein